MSEPNISKENKYFKIKEEYENKSFDKKDEDISSINNDDLNKNNNIKDFKKSILINENKIKEEYNIPKNKSLYILKIDVKQEGYQIPKIIYEVYYPLFGNNLIKLNLTVCEGIKIDISIPIKLPDNLDIYNSSSDYYNDICYTSTSEDGTDITLSDRKNN